MSITLFTGRVDIMNTS